MKRFRLCTTFLLILILAFSLFAREVTVSGTVVSQKTGDPLIGANVNVKGTSYGAATNDKGYFTFTFDTDQSFTLRAGYMGYKSKEIELSPSDDLTEMTIQLQEDILESERVVVTGIASETSKEVAPISVGTVNAGKLSEKVPYTNLSQLINGKVAGASMSSSSGNLGGGFRFDIRSGGGLNGDAQPVIYIDGIRVNNDEIESGILDSKGGQEISTLAGLDPDQIQDIEILKGPAAAATYGTDGSNGVVLITTKRGQLIRGAKSYTANYKYTTGYHEQSYEYTEDDILTYKDANNAFRQGNIEGHNFDISGGTESARYYFAVGQRSEKGIQINNYLKRKNFALNLDAMPAENLTLQTTANYSVSESSRPENDNNIYGWLGNTVLRPTPYAWLDSLSIAASDEEVKQTNFRGSISAKYNVLKNLSINGLLGVDNNSIRLIDYYPPWGNYLYDHGSRQIMTEDNIRYTYNFDIKYSYNIMDGLTGKSALGTQLMDRELRMNYTQADSLASDKVKDIASASQMSNYFESFITERRAGIFLTNSFNFKDKLFLGANIRRDFASSLSEKAPDIYYPQVNAAIRLDRFGLTPGFFDMAKLRVAYGETGQLPLPTQTIKLIWAAEQSGYGPAATVDEIGNIELEPERIKEATFGIDINMFGRFGIEATYSDMSAVNSIVGRQLAPSTGLIASNVPANIGEVQGWAFELGLNGRLVERNNFTLDFNQLNSWQEDEVVKLREPIFSAFDVQVTKEGLSRYTWYDYKIKEIVYGDDGKFQEFSLTDEKEELGTAVPFYNGSLSFTATLFNNFTVYTLFDWKTQFKVLNYTKVYQTYFGNNVDLIEAQETMAEADSTGEYNTDEYKNAVEDYVKYYSVYYGTYQGFVEEADYFKVRELSVSYDASGLLNNYWKRSGIRQLSFTLSAQNLLTWTKYSGPDPEVNMSGSVSNNPDRGLDFMTMQHPRTLTFKVQLGL